MNASDSSVSVTLLAAQQLIRATAATALAVVAHNLLDLMRSASTFRSRGEFAAAQNELMRSEKLFLSHFTAALEERISADIDPKEETKTPRGQTDWQSVSLVDEDQIDERIAFDRIGQLIAHDCEAELRELSAYTSALLRHGRADPERNPLRGEILGSAVHIAIEKTSSEAVTQSLLAREIGRAMAQEMPACYRAIIADMKQRGIRPVELLARTVENFPGRSQGGAFDDARKAWEESFRGRLNSAPAELPRSWEASLVGRFADADSLSGTLHADSSAALLDRLVRGAMPAPMPPAPGAPAADERVMQLLRRLNQGSNGRHGGTTQPRNPGPASPHGGALDGAPTRPQALQTEAPNYYAQPPASSLADLMAVNLIRAHRDELQQVSRSHLDLLVIDVVASLFDQILSDARVPPQMAHQLARLQLPVLRVALNDPSFFSSRRHPVRRFINRAASLVCAFDELSSGPGRELLERVSGLVTAIVEGEFDQLDLYETKLLELERFTAEQTHAEVRKSPAAATLRTKEIEWHVQQRFSVALHEALQGLGLPAFLHEFLSGVWGEAIVVASRRDGEQSEAAAKMRRTGADVIGSIQPQRSLAQRKHFLATLPALMAALTAGMDLVQWPKALRDDFFGQLMTQHAGSLKGMPLSDLDHNLMLRRVDAAFALPIPSADDAQDPLPAPSSSTALEQRFSNEEGEALGLISDSAVDWSGAVEPQPGVDAPPANDPDTAEAALSDQTARVPGLPPELENGPALRENLQLGFSYRLNLKGDWQSVRLTYMSPGRTLFLFARSSRSSLDP